ncbi:hypothetical protein CRENBAI_012220, partial [Crenichthys baileyi]
MWSPILNDSLAEELCYTQGDGVTQNQPAQGALPDWIKKRPDHPSSQATATALRAEILISLRDGTVGTIKLL